jgi:hypothetical protein
VVDYSEVLFRYSPEEIEENHDSSQSEQAVTQPRFELGAYGIQVWGVTTTPHCLVCMISFRGVF